MKLSDIDLRLLRVFQAVALAGGFGKAQATLGISQPAISAQIGKLEDRLGLRLCDRGPQGFSLTTEGRKVLDETASLLEIVDAAAERLEAIADKPSPRIRIGMVDCMITDKNNPMIDSIKALKQEVPDLNVQIGIYDFLECLSELRANRLDVAVVGVAADERLPSEAETVPLYDEVSSLYCAPDHPCASVTETQAVREMLSQSEISAHSFVFNPIDKDLDPNLLDNSKGVAQDTIELTAYLTLSGSHVGLLPDHYAEIWLRSGELVRVMTDDPPIVSTFHAVRLPTATRIDVAELVWQKLIADK